MNHEEIGFVGCVESIGAAFEEEEEWMNHEEMEVFFQLCFASAHIQGLGFTTTLVVGTLYTFKV